MDKLSTLDLVHIGLWEWLHELESSRRSESNVGWHAAID